MSVDLMVVIGCDAPLTLEALVRLPERLHGDVFTREADGLLRVAEYGGVQTIEERQRFCAWDWEPSPTTFLGFSLRTPWPKVVASVLKQGGRPSARWAGFSAVFHQRCVVMTHIEKYDGFLRNKRYGLDDHAGLRLHLRRCSFAVATAMGSRRALYLADIGAPAAAIRAGLVEGVSFDALVDRLEKTFGSPPSTFLEGASGDAFIDDFSMIDATSRLSLDTPTE